MMLIPLFALEIAIVSMTAALVCAYQLPSSSNIGRGKIVRLHFAKSMDRLGFKANVLSVPPTYSESVSFQCATIQSDALALDEKREYETLYRLPTRDRELSRLEAEFRSMMAEFSQYTPRDIESVQNPRYKILYEGLVAGAQEPAVYRSFEVLYEDMLPIRIAGRIIYRSLSDIITRSIQKRNEEEEIIAARTGLSTNEIDDSRRAFTTILHLDEEGGFTMEQLVASGIVDAILDVLVLGDHDSLLENLVENMQGKLNFQVFMVALHNFCKSLHKRERNVSAVLLDAAARMEPFEDRLPVDTKQKKKHSDRYDTMVKAFGEWEDRMPKREGRRIDILRGCFVGARNEKVVDALKVVYMDYPALRIAGDLIFKLMSRLVSAKRA